MKKLALVLFLVSTEVFALGGKVRIAKDVTYNCRPTGEYSESDIKFIIDLRVNGPNTMSYQRRNSDGFGEVNLVPRCGDMTQTWMDHWPEAFVFDCEDDGEQGSFQIDPTTLQSAEIYFYMPKLGFQERTLLELTCTSN